jgi:hypothetical protein
LPRKRLRERLEQEALLKHAHCPNSLTPCNVEGAPDAFEVSDQRSATLQQLSTDVRCQPVLTPSQCIDTSTELESCGGCMYGAYSNATATAGVEWVGFLKSGSASPPNQADPRQLLGSCRSATWGRHLHTGSMRSVHLRKGLQAHRRQVYLRCTGLCFSLSPHPLSATDHCAALEGRTVDILYSIHEYTYSSAAFGVQFRTLVIPDVLVPPDLPPPP